ncbi:hypothetical protein [Bradyrhizobium sp. CCBAU 53421]|uniref:hypothetical protein n=1 Tax=Bradyrhizobium sp. CCBAU 53421 TaxID=1325120 RepID=UPI00188CEBAB|nr:hypothetical protein [Bradyrhizobium sp. CCBAU 53421]QOZ34821.1 hypothetical protein XH92_26720 [Bradyrhizobium sp. CCBAU 53421]
MVRRSKFALGVAAICIGSASAQDAPPSYQADPTVYKVIFEDQNFRVIAATWKKGTTDKPHSHALPFMVYALDDCTVRVRNPDGTTRELKNKAGAASAGPITVSHTAENVGDSDCRALLVERK